MPPGPSTPRTNAGDILSQIMGSHTCPAPIPATFQEGTSDTASVWVTNDEGKYFQLHVTELHPTESDLRAYR